jgi:hypothetical protein
MDSLATTGLVAVGDLVEVGVDDAQAMVAVVGRLGTDPPHDAAERGPESSRTTATPRLCGEVAALGAEPVELGQDRCEAVIDIPQAGDSLIGVLLRRHDSPRETRGWDWALSSRCNLRGRGASVLVSKLSPDQA